MPIKVLPESVLVIVALRSRIDHNRDNPHAERLPVVGVWRGDKELWQGNRIDCDGSFSLVTASFEDRHVSGATMWIETPGPIAQLKEAGLK